ncbi:hypothetical protein MOB66_21270 [Bacillus haynesii]|uniref:Uncharacterized protein n=1 Tax=Bacillus haynesii TaxID=1925021 RepID=A0AA90IVL9_9BACI|nr:hypothetical protein [Bacillus haynesii]MCY7850013.1 hypothetical protein [Bacillus haynesii]MCY7914659.1 hypothetical protein [Bacillus haynesii]MCY7925848.1 hypothetical protein [Bacillus haynesii]MCY8006433.1 hypothetical protein [Bacillus haynesii]
MPKPGQDDFMLRFLLLEAGTFAVLYAVMLVCRHVDKSRFAAAKLGIVGSAVGLFLDAFLFMESFTDLPCAFRWSGDWICGLDGLRVCHVFDDPAHA